MNGQLGIMGNLWPYNLTIHIAFIIQPIKLLIYLPLIIIIINTDKIIHDF